MIYKTNGIIIRRTNLNEADRIVTIFSKDYGKIRIIAKGVRKINSKIAGNLEPFCLSSLNIAEGKNLDVVTSALIEKCYFNIRNDLKATGFVQYFGELIDKLTEDNDPHPEIYFLLDEVLDNLNSINSELLIPYFEWNLLSALGYSPELHRCVHCRKNIIESEKIYFNFDRGGLICKACNKGDLAISANAIKMLRLLLKHQINILSKIELDRKTFTEIKETTRKYLTHISDKEFKSQRFIK